MNHLLFFLNKKSNFFLTWRGTFYIRKSLHWYWIQRGWHLSEVYEGFDNWISVLLTRLCLLRYWVYFFIDILWFCLFYSLIFSLIWDDEKLFHLFCWRNCHWLLIILWDTAVFIIFEFQQHFLFLFFWNELKEYADIWRITHHFTVYLQIIVTVLVSINIFP